MQALDDEMRELVRRKRDVQIAVSIVFVVVVIVFVVVTIVVIQFERVEDRLKILKEQALKMDQVIKVWWNSLLLLF